MKIPVLNTEEAVDLYLKKLKAERPYRAMYSSLIDAIVTDPRMMIVPIDDHIVHRGDGIFEAFRSYDKAIYDLDAHLDRLEFSAESLGYKLPRSRQEISEICCAVGEASGRSDLTYRLYVSRGPGSFTPNPYESEGPQLYIVGTESKNLPRDTYEKGVSVGLSKFPAKALPQCQIKSCNYLINVLMKKEAVDRGLDFVVNLDPHGYIAEGPTENVALLTKEGEFLAPNYQHMLKGTTLKRCLELAQEHRAELGLKSVGQANLKPADFEKAAEIYVIGTTMGVLPVSQFAASKIHSTYSSSMAKRLMNLLEKDIATNEKRRTLYR
jgi:branched-subunit amino acid aminotransferase/4-amino-4-deoxychorismate lyase